MDPDLQRLTTHVEALRHTVYGNGKAGLSEAVRHVQEDLAEVSKSIENIGTKVDALEQARARDENMREGGRRTLVALGAILTILSGAGAAVSVRVLQTLAEVAKALP